ncbi:hypothetical protein [Ruegeria arenilitoris]|uniref:hypothetical protein n=1 Tax=Ruegeria arenilitoris TaxID=1173585 RepID=UPI001480E3A8|nr:hypothetical protein [Ruegeria arenilitoris]
MFEQVGQTGLKLAVEKDGQNRPIATVMDYRGNVVATATRQGVTHYGNPTPDLITRIQTALVPYEERLKV